MRHRNSILFYILLLIATVILLSSKWTYAKQRKTSWDTTIGTIYNLSQAGSFCRISYTVNGKTYKDIVGGWDEDAYVGEKYLIYYDPRHPAKKEINFTRPVFEEGESTLLRIGKIIKIKEQKFAFTTNRLRYGFKSSSGEVIKRNMSLPDNYKELYPNIGEGQYYNIQVWERNAYRSILRLDLGLVEEAEEL